MSDIAPTLAAAFLAALLAALALTPAVRRLALRAGVLDQALSSRKVHGRPIPRLGGLAMVAAFLTAVAAVALADERVAALLRADARRLGALLLGALVVAGLGLHDDLHGAGARTKLSVELAVAGLLYAAGLRVEVLDLPFLAPIALGALSLPVTVLWVAGVTNAVNLIDGLDGLAAGVALVAALATGALALLGGGHATALLAAALAGAALGFLRSNTHPASIFMGDTGSLFLGFLLAALPLLGGAGGAGGQAPAGLLGPALVLGVPIADTLLSIGRRLLRGAPVFRADRGHLHHRLLDGGLGHRGAVAALHGASLLLSAAALLLATGGAALDAAVLVTLSVAGPAALWRLGAVGLPDLATLRRDRRRNLERLAMLRWVRLSLRAAADGREIFAVVRRAAGLLGARGVELVLPLPAGRAAAARYQAGPADEALLRTRATDRSGATLELRWSRPALDRDTEIAVEILGGAVDEAVVRLRRGRAPVTLARLRLTRADGPGRAA